MANGIKTLRSSGPQQNTSNSVASGIQTLRSAKNQNSTVSGVRTLRSNRGQEQMNPSLQSAKVEGPIQHTGNPFQLTQDAEKQLAEYYEPDYRLGNIDIREDPVRGFTGKRYTVYFDLRNGENVVIPAVKFDYFGMGKELTDEEAIKQYLESGQYYGKFKPITQEQELTDYLHELELDAQKFRLKNGIEKYGLGDMFAAEQLKRNDKKETDERKPFSTLTAEKHGITLPEASTRPEEDPIALKAEAYESLQYDRDVERMRELYGESSESALGTLGLAVSSGLSNFESGFSNAIFGTAELISGKENAAHRNNLRRNDALQQVAAEERAEMSAAQGVIFDLTQSFAQNAPSMALSVAGGGILGSALTFASTYGNELHYAQKAGADTKTAVTYAFLDGLTQAFLDYAGYLPGAKTITKGAANALSKNISSATLKYIGRVGANMVGEGITEAFQTSIENGLRNVALGEQNDTSIFSEEALYAAFLGALSAGTMDGISTTAEAVANHTAITKIGNDYLNNNKVGEALKIGLSNAKSSDLYRTAQSLERKFNNNETISAYELGKMVADSQTEKAILAREIERLALESGEAHNVDTKIAEEVATVATRLGRPVVFDSAENMKTVGQDGQVYYESGRYDRNTGTITLNAAARSEDLVNYVLKHELAHSVERTKLGKQLEQIVRSSMGAEFDAAVQAKLAEYQNYGKKLDEAGAKHEVVAQWLGKNLYQNGFAQAVVNGDAKVGNVILRTLDQVRLALGGTQKSRTAANIAIVERLFMRALQQSPALDNSGGVQYSLGNLPQKNNNNTQNSDISEETMYNNKWASYELTAEFVTKVPYDERHTFLRSLANKTNGMKQGECKSIIIFTDKHVYFYEATGYMDGSIEEVLSVGSKKAKAKIKAWGDISDSSDANATTLDSWAQTYGSIKGRNGGYNATNGYTEETGRIDNVDDQKQDGNSFGYNWGSDEDFSGVEELIPGSFVFTDDGRSFKVNDDGTTEDIQFSNIETEYANTKSFEESPPSQDGAGFFDAQNGTQSSFEGSDEIAEAVALMEREQAEKSTAPVEENDTLPLSRQSPTAPLTRGAEGEMQQGDAGTAPATNIPSPLESGRENNPSTADAVPLPLGKGGKGTVSQAQTVDELTAEIGDEAMYRRMYYAAQIDRPPATLDIDGHTVNTTAYMDELYVALPDDDLQLTAYLKEREAEKAAQVAERFARGETDAEWTEVDLQILTARSKLEWSELGDSGESGSKTRRFYEQRLKGRDVNKAHETELLELLAGRSETYNPIANQKTLDRAKEKLRNAEYQARLQKRILRYKPNDLFNAVDAAAAQVMINDARNEGDLELYASLVSGLSKKGTELGRAVQVLSMQRRMTPEGTLKAAQRTLRSQADRAMYDGANEDLDVFAEQITDAIERAAENKKATTSGDNQPGGIKHTEYSNEDLRRNAQLVAQMSSVYDVPAERLENTDKTKGEIYRSFFESLGNRIYSKEFGEISLSNASVRSEIGHGSTAAKIASVEAIPSVINNGKVIWFAEKEAGVKRILVCAPITIGNKPYYMGVMLQRDAQYQRLYLHDVVIEEEAATLSQVDLSTTGTHERNDNLYTTSILRNALAVKQQYVQQGGESVQNPMTRDELTEALAQDITGDNSPYITADEIRGILERAVESASDIPDQLKRYLKKNLGSDMGTLAQRIAKLHEAGHLNDMTMRRVMEETLHLPTLTDEDVNTLTGLVNALNDAPEGSVQQLEATEDIYRFLGEKLIVTKLDFLQSWRKFGMLFNLKTHLRNFGSNAVFAGVDRMDGLTATLLERILIPEAAKRTAAFGWSLTEQGQQIRPAIEKSLEQALLKMHGQGQKYEISNGVLNQYRKAFGKNKFGETLNTLNEKNSQLLEWEDAIFFKAAYTNALGQIMVARGLTEVNSAVEEIAYNRAIEAVFRGENAMTNVLASIKRYQNSNKLGHALFGHAVDVAIPFSKTPANIAYQAVEHSPIGLVKGAWDILQVTRGKSPKSMAEAINLTAKGVSGSILLGIGMLLGSAGLFVTGFGKTEKERAADELAGIQENAFRFGNVTISLDWLQPAASPLIVGASIAQRLKEDGLSLGSVFGATFDGTDSLFEMTMLQSLYDVLGGYEAGASASVASVAENLLSQSIPTVFGQVARAVDPVQRKANGESALTPIIGNGTFAKVAQRVLARIPGLTYLLEPELDVWGNTVYRTGKVSTMSGILNALQQFILPANVKIATGDDEISQIVMELYNSDEEQPGRALPTAITREKAAELGVSYEDVNRLLGQNQHAALLAILQDREKYTVTHETTRGGKTVKQKRQKYWSDMTDEERLQVLKKVYQAEKDNITDPDGEYYEEIVRRMS